MTCTPTHPNGYVRAGCERCHHPHHNNVRCLVPSHELSLGTPALRILGARRGRRLDAAQLRTETHESWISGQECRVQIPLKRSFGTSGATA